MHPRQRTAYWLEWTRLRDTPRGRGRTTEQLELQRREVTRRAFGAVGAQGAQGAVKSSRWLMAREQVEAIALRRCEAACLALADRACGEYQFHDPVTRARYIARVCKELNGCWPSECAAAELERVAEEIEGRVRVLAERMREHLQGAGQMLADCGKAPRAKHQAPEKH